MKPVIQRSDGLGRWRVWASFGECIGTTIMIVATATILRPTRREDEVS